MTKRVASPDEDFEACLTKLFGHARSCRHFASLHFPKGELVSHFESVKGCRVYMVLNSWSLEKRAWCNHTSFLDMRAQVQKPQRVYVRVCADTYVSHPFAMYGVPLPCWLKLEGA